MAELGKGAEVEGHGVAIGVGALEEDARFRSCHYRGDLAEGDGGSGGGVFDDGDCVLDDVGGFGFEPGSIVAGGVEAVGSAFRDVGDGGGGGISGVYYLVE